MPKVFNISLPLRTVSEANQREHWAKKAKRVKDFRWITRFKVIEYVPGVLAENETACVILTRIAPRALDDDNLRGATKAIRDGVADALGINDRNPKVKWEYLQRKGEKGEYGLEITIEIQ